MFTQKKRRRRRKKSVISVSTVQKLGKPYSSITSVTITNSTIPKTIPSLSKAFINEEIEVRNAIVQSKIQNNIFNQSCKIETGKKFFADNIYVSDFDIIPTIIVAPEITPSSGKRTLERDAQQLASSYVQIDDETVIQKWSKKYLHFNYSTYYYPLTQIYIGLENREYEPKLHLYTKNITEDGLFTSEKPYISNKNKNILINRFIAEESDKWLVYYRSDKSLDISDLINFSHDSQLYKTYNNTEKTNFKATELNIECLRSNEIGNISSSTLTDRLLRIYISNVNFHTHPSYTKEYIYAKRLEFLYQLYSERAQNKVIEKLENHLQSIRHLLKGRLLEMGDNSNPNHVDKLKNDLRDTRNQLHHESKYDRELLQSLLELWKMLKDLRKKQGFNKTSIRMLIKMQEVDIDSDRENWKKKFEDELNEILEERKDSEMDIMYDVKYDTKYLPKPDKANICEKLYQVYMKSMRHPGESIVSIELEKLSTIGIEYDSSDSSSMIVFQVMFDDQKVGSLKRNTSFGVNGYVNVNGMFCIKLSQKIPKKISIIVSVFFFFNYYFGLLFLIIIIIILMECIMV